ncbi:MAG TPA: hemerythrin domain-containing protein [Gammaproteobacteria bacterium]
MAKKKRTAKTQRTSSRKKASAKRGAASRRAASSRTSAARSASRRSAASRSAQSRSAAGRASRRGNGAGRIDAITLLKQDHRDVEQTFQQFERARAEDEKKELGDKVAMLLTVHAAIEEELFYPAYLEATGDLEMHHEAFLEHANAKNMIAEIQRSGPEDEYYDARMSVLSEMVKHHVKEEEKRGGLFARAKESGLDLMALGEKLEARKQELMRDRESLTRMALEAPRAQALMAAKSGNRAHRVAARRA